MMPIPNIDDLRKLDLETRLALVQAPWASILRAGRPS